MRFGELRRAVAPISSKMLTTTLKKLVEVGLASRTHHPEIPPRVEYRLTPLGLSAAEPIADILRWARDYLGEIQKMAQELQQRPLPESIRRRYRVIAPRASEGSPTSRRRHEPGEKDGGDAGRAAS